MERTLLSFIWALPSVTKKDHERIVQLAAGDNATLVPVGVPGSGDDWSVAEAFLTDGGSDGTTPSPKPASTKQAKSQAKAAPPAAARSWRRFKLSQPVSITLGTEPLVLDLFYSWHDSYRTALVTAAVAMEDGELPLERRADRTIALIQSLTGKQTRSEQDLVVRDHQGNAYPSVARAARGALEAAGLEVAKIFPGALPTWCVERRSDRGTVGRLSTEAMKAEYGLSTGDEGWRFVPEAVATERLGAVWATREFVRVQSVGDGVVMHNAKGGRYIELQRRFTEGYFGTDDPYFSLDSRIAGLDHGVLFALERVIMRKARSLHWVSQVDVNQLTSTGKRKEYQLVRDSLDSVSSLVRPKLLSEVDALEQMLSDHLGLSRLLEYLDRLGGSIDEKIRFTYESQVDAGITRLTWITVALAVITIVQGVVSWWF